MTNKNELASVPRELLERICTGCTFTMAAQEYQELCTLLATPSAPFRARAFDEEAERMRFEAWYTEEWGFVSEFHKDSTLQGWLARAKSAPAEDVRAVVDEPVHQVRSHGSCCWEDVSGESLESCRCQPEHYEIRELYRRPQCSEVSQQCSEHLRTQGKLLPTLTLLPHPPRHWGFLQPEREVPGYTIEQMKEYGALCAAEAIRQNQ
jgi:hypothetical protein